MQTVTVPEGPHTEPDLDEAWLRPNYHAVIADQFDAGRGYSALMQAAAKKTPWEAPGPVHPVIRDGVVVVHALSVASRQRLQDMVAASPTGFVTSEDMGHTFVAELCEELFEGSPGEALRALYGPNFGAIYLSARRQWTAATNEAKGQRVNSSRWHCDGGPTAHGRVLVYLNGPEEHDAATWVADLQTTEILKRVGYVFCQMSDRIEDLGPFCERLGIPFAPRRFAPKAGEALVFEPGRHLHKGEMTTRGYRDTLHVGVVPAVTGWRRWLDQAWVAVRGNNDNFPNVSVE